MCATLTAAVGLVPAGAIVRDQVGAPTRSREIAVATTRMLAKVCGEDSDLDPFFEVSEINRMTAAGETTWYDFAKTILEEAWRHAPRASWFIQATSQRPLITRCILPRSGVRYRVCAVWWP